MQQRRKIALQNSHPHPTRDAQFAEKERGDISGWASATTWFRRPEKIGKTWEPEPAIVIEGPVQPAAPVAVQVVLVAPQDKAEGVSAAIRSCDKAIKAFECLYRMQRGQAEVALALKEGREVKVKEYV